jgi:hypothetical protein
MTPIGIAEQRRMRAWYHCEDVYQFVPQDVLDVAPSVRASLPNKYCDPRIAADLFHECFDEHLLCDNLGVNIVSIEHHSGINIDAEHAIARGILVAGNPVARQIMGIYDKGGGFGNFIFVGRSGFVDHREAEKGIRLMAKEVIPRLPAATTTLEPARAAAE